MDQAHGFCAPGWEGVRDAFAANLTAGLEVGAAYSVHHDGRLVVDLWGGTYRPDTLQLVFSTTKGWTATLANLLVERGQLDLDAPGRVVLAGVRGRGQGRDPGALAADPPGRPAVPRPSRARSRTSSSWDGVVAKLAALDPAVGAGHRPRLPRRHLRLPRRRGAAPHHRPHGRRRCSPTRSPARSASTPGSACPPTRSPGSSRSSAGSTPDAGADVDPAMRAMLEQFLGPESPLGKALVVPRRPRRGRRVQPPEVRAAEIPAANGVTDARSLSRLYAALIGDVRGRRAVPRRQPRARARDRRGRLHPPDQRQRPRACSSRPTFGLGFMTVVAVLALRRPGRLRPRRRRRLGRLRRPRRTASAAAT